MCPRCRQDKMFVTPFKVKKPLQMHKNCRVCGLDFEPEPGYYYGAMFMSYTLSSLIMLPVMLVLLLGFHWNIWVIMLVILLMAVLGYFKLLRFSRSIWIHIMERFDPDIKPGSPDLDELP